MELQELMTIDPESLTARQAQQVVRDTIATLSNGVSHEYQQSLRTLLIDAQQIAEGRTIGEASPDVRADVLERIREAETRGDKRTARFLMEGMAQSDMATIDAEEKASEGALAVEKLIADDLAAEKDRLRKDEQQRIELRTHELLRVDGSTYGYSIKRARAQASREIVRPRYEDDINPDSAA